MQTWLDEYVRAGADMMDDWLAFLRKEYGVGGHFASDHHKAATLTTIAYTTPQALSKFPSKMSPDFRLFHGLFYDTVPQRKQVQLENLANKVIYFLTPITSDGDKPPVAIQITPELAADFWDAAAPDDDEYFRLFDTIGQVYMDFPPGSIMFNDELELRALFVSADLKGPRDLTTFWMTAGEPIVHPDGWPKLNILAVLARPGKRVDLVTNVYQIGFAEGEPWSIYGYDTTWSGSVAHKAGEQDAPSRFRPVMDQLTDMVKLVLLYYMTEGAQSRQTLPHVTVEALEKLKRHDKQRAKQKTHSLFRVVKLKPPVDRFGRTDADRQGSSEPRKLTVQTRVRGHFRRVRCGEGRKDRRLRFIAPFMRGPKDAPIVHKLTVLEPKP